MSTSVSQPVLRAFFNEECKKRSEKCVFAAPLSELSKEDSVLIDIALNNIVTVDSVLPHDIENYLKIAANYCYQVTDYKGQSDYNQRILVIVEGNTSKIKIAVHDKNSDIYSVQMYRTVAPEYSSLCEFTDISKTEYVETATRLTDTSVLQYSPMLHDAYKLLFHLVFRTELETIQDADSVEDTLNTLLLNTEVTLHLNITSTVKLYGTLHDDNVLTLYIREIGTPDTFWSQTVLLPEVIDQSLSQTK